MRRLAAIILVVCGAAIAGCGTYDESRATGDGSCSYQWKPECDTATTPEPAPAAAAPTTTGEPAAAGSDVASDPRAEQDSDGDGVVDLYDDAPMGQDGNYNPAQAYSQGETPPPVDGGASAVPASDGAASAAW